MTFRLCVFAHLAVLLPLGVTAQEDDTIQFNQGLPEAGIDSSLYDEVNLDNPPDHFQKVELRDVPVKLKAELDGDEMFSGWQQRTVWRDDNTGLYWIDLDSGPGVRSYGFTGDGRIVSVKENTNTNSTRSP